LLAIHLIQHEAGGDLSEAMLRTLRKLLCHIEEPGKWRSSISCTIIWDCFQDRTQQIPEEDRFCLFVVGSFC